MIDETREQATSSWPWEKHVVTKCMLDMLDIERSVDAELGTALVSQQLSELPHAPPVQPFTVGLVETFRLV
ncbi:hypothetical protein TNCV_1867191 [Trichonephila clavipes]|nr:hypothetical protein TNCV_1867191 [Trichonephila clavipes]